jgi:hypothetical protein
LRTAVDVAWQQLAQPLAGGRIPSEQLEDRSGELGVPLGQGDQLVQLTAERQGGMRGQ